MKLYEAEQFLRNKLTGIYDQSEAQQIASMAMEQVSGLAKYERIAQKELQLGPDHLMMFERITNRLIKHEPIQYIMNKSWFYNMELYVDSNVLIPRPETEELVDWAVRDVKASGKDVFDNKPTGADETTLLKILDVGTGSGCIALALKKTMPRAEVWGCDISDEALTVARRNGSALNIRVDFQALNFLDQAQQKQLPSVDIVISNPPYVPAGDSKSMQPNVIDHEPHQALFVPDNDALVFYQALAIFGSHRLHEGGAIYMEIHESLGKDVVNLFSRNGYRDIELRRDMQGKERMVKVRKKL